MKDGIAYLLARALPACVNLCTIAVLSRLLTAVEYGRYSLIVTASGVLNIFFFSWSAQAVFRHFASWGPDTSRVIAVGVSGYGLSLLLAAICAVAVVVIPVLALDGVVVSAAFALLAMLAWLDLVGILINLQGKAGRYAGLHLARAAATLIAGSAAAYWALSANAVIMSMALAYLGIAALRPFRSWIEDAEWKAVDGALLLSFARYGIPLAMSILLMLIAWSVDRFILAHFAGAAIVGGYAIGSDLAQFAIGALAGSLGLAYYPRLLATLEEKGEVIARQQLTKYSVILLAVILPAAVGLAAVSPNLLEVLVGEGLRKTAAQVMPWTCISAFFLFFKTGLLDYAFQMGRWPIGGLVIAALTVAVNLVANLIFVPQFGGVGAAAASAGSMAFGTMASLFVGRWRRLAYRPSFHVNHAKVVIATIAMLLVLLQLPTRQGAVWLLVQVVVGAVSYGFCCYMMNAMGIRSLRLRDMMGV